ncbi:MAG: CocE/NonD family hydrolase [Gomphosphaeria aponina SAG 52.96 = DSM 107014]|uniref:CocE/NonD family hydrolase n=1 Tax=Gomphosphaeria aponina SAG 52.96 = DSM 107014 TaxID=1521640 RepID=A0A941GU28_9CHRO|nr:CocE/NonD family hydrolase [Gomphosphaeria aponina SAG 52.96 = DSM 107014]
METHDGVRLEADIYRRESEENLPVLLMRQPYGKAIASTVVYAHPSWYAAQGFLVVIQDVRGRGTSEGEFKLFSHEIEDGLETVNWVAQLPGSNGKVGMYGFSYQGMTQLYAACSHPTALKTICPAMIAYDLYTDWAYENGAFCLQANLAWAIQLAAETARRQSDILAYNILAYAAQNLPLSHPSNQFIENLRKYAPSNFYYEWLNHPHPGEYWAKLSPKNLMQDVDLPMLHIGGWFDPYLRGTINLYQEMKTRSKLGQKLIIGPWGHLPWGHKLGEIDYGEAAISQIDILQVNWFNKYLKGIDTELLDKPPVALFEMGSNQWQYFENFPHNNQQTYYLASNGLASIQAGELITQKNTEIGEDKLVHDPWRPVPSLGGHGAIPAGSFDRSRLDCRSDILTYISPNLPEDLHIVGEVKAEFYCVADSPSFDLCAILSEMYPDGRVYNFSQGYVRVNSDKLPVKLSLQPTCMRLSQGNRLCLSLSAACFPAYAVNPGTGQFPEENDLIERKIITLTLHSGGDHPSQIRVWKPNP